MITIEILEEFSAQIQDFTNRYVNLYNGWFDKMVLGDSEIEFTFDPDGDDCECHDSYTELPRGHVYIALSYEEFIRFTKDPGAWFAPLEAERDKKASAIEKKKRDKEKKKKKNDKQRRKRQYEKLKAEFREG